MPPKKRRRKSKQFFLAEASCSDGSEDEHEEGIEETEQDRDFLETEGGIATNDAAFYNRIDIANTVQQDQEGIRAHFEQSMVNQRHYVPPPETQVSSSSGEVSNQSSGSGMRRSVRTRLKRKKRERHAPVAESSAVFEKSTGVIIGGQVKPRQTGWSIMSAPFKMV